MGVIRVLKDVAIIFLLFIILYIGFSLAMYAMYKPFKGDVFRYPEQALESASSTFSNLFWRFFDPGEPGSVTIMSWTQSQIEKMNESLYNDYQNDSDARNKERDDMIADGTQSLQFSHGMGVSFWAVYQGIVAIILINVLIALMNTTYTKISQDSDIEWKYSKSFMYAQFLSTRAALPPPFRWFYYLALLVRWVKRRSQNHNVERRNTLEKQKYFGLLTKLVKTKMQLDIEDSIEDDFDDLRKDLKNVVNNNVVKKLDILEKKNEELAEELASCKASSSIMAKELASCKASSSIILAKLEEVLSKLPSTALESS